MATAEACEQALHTLADRLAASAPTRRRADFDRSLSCTLTDLEVVFTGRLRDGQLVDIARSTNGDAEVRLTLTSDDLLALVDGDLAMSQALATRRIRVDAGVRDLLRLRSIF